MRQSSIRSRLLLLVVAMSAALAVSVGIGIYSDMQQTIANTKASLRTLANTMVSNTGTKIGNVRQTLERLSDRPLVKQIDSQNCDPILKDLLGLNPDYANVAYTNMEGVVVCSAVGQPDDKPVNVGKTPWFRKFLSGNSFAVGDPFLGPITGKWVSVLSVPIRNARQQMIGGMHFPMDLRAFDPNIPAQFLTSGSRYGFFTGDGILVWRNLDPEGVIGLRPNAKAAQTIVTMRDGEFEDVAVDGVTRFFSVVPMQETGWIAFVGVPVSEVYAGAKQRAMVAAAIAFAAIALLGYFALVITRRITNPIAELERGARSVLQGDLRAKVTVGGPGEVVSVATTFNAMVEKVDASTRQLEAAKAELDRAQAASHVGSWVWDAASDTMRLSNETCRIFAMKEDASESRELYLARAHEQDREVLKRAWQEARAMGTAFDHEHRIVVDGEIHWVRQKANFSVTGLPQSVEGIAQDVTERRKSHDALQASLAEKEALLKEVHHRVKNNLQVITSLLRLEGRRNEAPAVRSVLTDMQGRIRSMALLHESLYRSGTFASVDLGNYLGQLATQAFRAQVSHADLVLLRLNMGTVRVGMDQAISCGLLVNELISNCLKHGFPDGRAGEVEVSLWPAGPENQGLNAQWCLSVSDTGAGLPLDFESRPKTSLGMQLVDDLSKQLEGAVTVDSIPGQGVKTRVIFTALAPTPLVMPV